MLSGAPADYAAALLPDRHRVCGLRLRPHSLGHAVLLHRLSSPYALVTPSRRIAIGDTVLASYICSRPWRKAADGVESPLVSIWLRCLAAMRWHQESADQVAMCAYVGAAWSSPTTFSTRRGGSQRGTDILQVLVSSQRRFWGKTLEHALDTPVAEAILDRLERMEEEGTLRIWGPRDSALSAKLEEIEARRRGAAEHNKN